MPTTLLSYAILLVLVRGPAKYLLEVIPILYLFDVHPTQLLKSIHPTSASGLDYYLGSSGPLDTGIFNLKTISLPLYRVHSRWFSFTCVLMGTRIYNLSLLCQFRQVWNCILSIGICKINKITRIFKRIVNLILRLAHLSLQNFFI